MAKNNLVSLSTQQEAELDGAFLWAQQLVDWQKVDQEYPRRENAVFSNSVTLLMLLKNKPSILPDNKRVLENTLSSDTGGYAKARKRQPLSAVKWLSQNVSQALIDVTQSSLLGERVYFFDGTTMTLAPVEALRKVYPPASNQYGEGAFPVALLVMAFELQSGAASQAELHGRAGDIQYLLAGDEVHNGRAVAIGLQRSIALRDANETTESAEPLLRARGVSPASEVRSIQKTHPEKCRSRTRKVKSVPLG